VGALFSVSRAESKTLGQLGHTLGSLFMKKLVAVLAVLLCCASVQGQNIEGQIIASQYGKWKVPGYVYAPTEPEPKLMTKEIPTIWQTINWDYQHLIWCCVDEENKEIRIGIPVGSATVPNQTLTMNYMEGLTGPIHFSQYAGREVAMGAARKWSVDDIAGSVAVRCERALPENASPIGALRQSQVLIGSSAPDGTVQMIATGVYNDNGSGIACQYETTSTQDLMAVSMLGGVSINALGQGSMTVSVMVARSFVDSQEPGANEIKLAPFRLTPENWRGYSGGGRGQNERFRMRFTNGTIANAWFALKYCSLFTRPLFTGRTGDDT
jgi:hypothetical protein